MRKCFKLLALLLVSCACLNSIDANASKAPAPDEKVYTWSMDEPLLTNVTNDGKGQICSNAQAGGDESPTDGSNYAQLIDDNIGTLFHSIWSTDYAVEEAPKSGPGYHNLQVRLDEAVDVFFFRYTGRNDETYHDNPTDIAIYATNDDELGASPKYDVSPNDKWEFITELTEGFPTNSAGQYTSPAIVMNQAYKYIRFVVKNTNTCNTVSWRVFTYPEITGVTFNLSEFQMYPGHEVEDAQSLLQVLYNEIQDAGLSIIAGTDPGYYPEDLANAFNAAYTKAEEALQTGNGDFEALYENLKKTYNDVKDAIITVKSGYYTFISAYAGFEEKQGVKMSLQAFTQSTLRWKAYSDNNVYSLFKVTDLGDGTYTVQNVATEEYLSTVAGTATVQKTNPESTPQIFTSVGTQQWLISNTANPLGYTVDAVGSGANKTGNIVTWTGGVNTTSSWYIHEVTDEALIEEIKASAASQIASDLLANTVESTASVRETANDYVSLLTSADQLTSNSRASEGSLANLLDGDTGTIFHSLWEDAMANAATTEGIGWHNLQINVGKEVSKIRFTFTGRDNSSGWHDNPTHITLFGTNDDALGASTATADSVQWARIVDMTQENYDLPGNDNAVSYTSPVIDLNGSYKYLRFVVKHVSTMDGGNRSTSFAVPEITGVTYNLSEFRLYDATPAETSEYYTVAGMKEACDAYDALVAAAAEKIANKTATSADVAAIEAAAKNISGLYVDRTLVQKEMADALEEANELYNNVVAYQMIRRATNNSDTQIKVNSSNGYSLSYLIDGTSTDAEAIFHSQWVGDGDVSMKDANMTEETWKTYNEANRGVGIGYHNIQFILDQPESKFKFMYITRNSSNWADTPNYIKILATNDDNLGASVDNADEASWDEILTMADKSYYMNMYSRELPASVMDVKFPQRGQGLTTFNSPEIDLGKEYKYIRFVILGTNNADLEGADRGINRVFASPDITGISWNLTELQLYGLGSAAQINSVPGMKDAADKLKEVLDAYNALDKYAYTQTTVDNLNAALSAVKALYIDQSQLAVKIDTLVRKGRKLYSAVNGTPLITSADQLSANSEQVSQGGGVGALIDDDYSTVFHSVWYNATTDGVHSGMKSDNITADEWMALMDETPTEYVYTGTGYHNLQVKFDHPVSKFFYEYTGRNSATWSDSPTDIAIFATNDDELAASTDNADQDSWTSITELKEGASANSALAYFRSSEVDLGDSYKYVRLVIKGTTNSSRPEAEADAINRLYRSPEVTGITWNASEFQMYEPGENAQVNYIAGMKEAAQKLYDEIAAKENIATSAVTTSDYLNLKEAYDNVMALYADNASLREKLEQIEEVLAVAEVDENKVGYAPSQDVIDELQAIYDKVNGGVSSKPTKEELEADVKLLDEGFSTYASKMNTIEPGKWYYISNAATEGNYASGAKINMSSANSGSNITWLGEVTGDETEGLATAMWRFVPIEGKTGQYAVQNYMTTHYIGAFRGRGNNYQPLVSAEPEPYIVEFVINGQMRLVSQDSTNVNRDPLHAQQGNQLLVAWPGEANTPSVWNITEVEGDDAMFYVPQNSMQIVTLPFDMEDGSSIADINPDVVTYSLKNVTIDNGKTLVELTQKNSFKAGEPFIMTVGNYEEYDSSNSENVSLVFYRQPEISAKADTVNGLIGTFDKIALNKKRMGYATYDGLHLTTASTVINGLSGYINPTLVQPQEGQTDLQIVVNGLIDAINPINAANASVVNVYTIDGKLIKRNVKSTDAVKSLKKGIYIVGKKKIAVK